MNPIKVKTILSLFDIHKYIFQDIYEWSGQARTVEITKNGDQFSPVSEFKERLTYINSLINKYHKIYNMDVQLISQSLAEILDEINWLHPFREGNGRTQRTFITFLAREKGYNLELNTVENPLILEEYMKGTIQGSVQLLANLIANCIKPICQKHQEPNCTIPIGYSGKR